MTDPLRAIYHSTIMQQLWAPWRMAYLERGNEEGRCFLCEVASPWAPDAGPPDIVVWHGVSTYALLNAYPYANGHVMVAPYAHEGALDALDDATAAELMVATRLVIRALRRAFQPQGFNIGANLGSAAGAGFGDHVHLHVVPRWSGDTNFMTTTGGTRVIPESLEETARRVREAITAIEGSGG